MLMRLVIRFAASLIGIVAGLLICGAVLTQFHIDAAAVIEAALLFWVIHMIVQLIALRVLVREPSVALAGLLALASTIISLIIVNAIISGLTIHRLYTYALATIIIWITTALADMIGRRLVRKRRAERKETETVR
jgi:CDP-diglyceride synthetase